jgi:hypothetical protein
LGIYSMSIIQLLKIFVSTSTDEILIKMLHKNQISDYNLHLFNKKAEEIQFSRFPNN